MGDIIDFCQKILADDNFEGVFVPQNNDNNSRINKKRKSDIKLKEVKDIFIPLNSTGENINFNKLKSANKNRNNSEENNKVNINRNGCISGEENELISSMNKMNKMIESLENKNKILEDEKLEMKKENDKLLEEIKSYKDTISKFKNLSNSQNDKNENGIGNNNKNLKEMDV
jgi:predicted RNase H-like nuclease (RuvC/YqgF family)